MPTDPESKLRTHRDSIDAIDAQLLALMRQRVAAAQRIGEIKAALDEPAFYRPEREAQVLKRLQALNREQPDRALTEAAVEVLFREIMSITRGAEAELSAAILGPFGTYCEAAARRHFGSSIKLVPHAAIDDIFRAAETGQTDFAVAPVENSTEGGVGDTLDRLTTTSLLACGEINLRIRHNLLGGGGMAAVARVIAHPQALAQCKRWLDSHLPGIEQVGASSNAEAAALARDDPSAAAIAGEGAAQRYQLTRLATHIEDEPGNATRFLVFSNRPAGPSGDDKTSLLLSCRHRPGALFHLLKPLLDHGVDMTKIESRPSKISLWEYVFFVDIAGHSADEKIAAALAELKAEAGLYKYLGSYPAAR